MSKEFVSYKQRNYDRIKREYQQYAMQNQMQFMSYGYNTQPLTSHNSRQIQNELQRLERPSFDQSGV